jgi:molecular chaperone GrpE
VASENKTPTATDQSLVADPAVQDLNSEQEMELVRTELNEARDKMLRAQAELENYRKRARRELDDERKYAEINLLRDLLPVVDNIGRATEAAGKNADAASLLEGIRMVQQQLKQLLERHHCQAIAPDGQHFDPAHHEAVMQQVSKDHEPSTVLAVVQTGYQLYDRVIRPAQVVVSKKE